MNRKSYISLLFLLAFAVLFTHNIVPHHHHNQEKFSLQLWEHHHYDDHDDNETSPLSHALGLFQHTTGGTIFYESAFLTFKGAKLDPRAPICMAFAHYISPLEKPPLLFAVQNTLLCNPVIYTITNQFRGPPSISI